MKTQLVSRMAAVVLVMTCIGFQSCKDDSNDPVPIERVPVTDNIPDQTLYDDGNELSPAESEVSVVGGQDKDVYPGKKYQP